MASRVPLIKRLVWLVLSGIVKVVPMMWNCDAASCRFGVEVEFPAAWVVCIQAEVVNCRELP